MGNFPGLGSFPPSQVSNFLSNISVTPEGVFRVPTDIRFGGNERFSGAFSEHVAGTLGILDKYIVPELSRDSTPVTDKSTGESRAVGNLNYRGDTYELKTTITGDKDVTAYFMHGKVVELSSVTNAANQARCAFLRISRNGVDHTVGGYQLVSADQIFTRLETIFLSKEAVLRFLGEDADLSFEDAFMILSAILYEDNQSTVTGMKRKKENGCDVMRSTDRSGFELPDGRTRFTLRANPMAQNPKEQFEIKLNRNDDEIRTDKLMLSCLEKALFEYFNFWKHGPTQRLKGEVRDTMAIMWGKDREGGL